MAVIHEALASDEQAVIGGLREIPDGARRDELIALILDMVDFARDPRCPENQADGVPCESVDVACAECRRVASVLGSLHGRLRPGGLP